MFIIFFSYFFIDINFKSKITELGKNVFGVYLFHNGKLLNPLIGLLGLTSDMYFSKYYFGYIAIGVCAIFILGIIIDQIRIHTIERVLMKLLDGPMNYINLKVGPFLQYKINEK